jgi:CheY-like chemotaxis protein
VEDDVFNIKLVEHLFSEYGMKADVALNGKLAVEKIANNKYDLVLMDMEMPEMDGYEATVYTRNQLNNNVPIIALTAHAMAGEREKCLQMGMNEYITKPINANHLFEIIYRTVKPAVPEKKGVSEAVTNLNYLKETLNGKKEAIKEMLTYLLKQLPENLSALSEAIDRKEFSSIAKLSHKIKSSVAIMGVKRLQPILVEMEALGKSSSNIDKLQSLYMELDRIVQQALIEIQQEKTKYQ